MQNFGKMCWAFCVCVPYSRWVSEGGRLLAEFHSKKKKVIIEKLAFHAWFFLNAMGKSCALGP